ncbi:MAG TPA: phosphoadenylyl-sulfate reductase [Chloroflexota bacterium]|nr:phosphoadenylyl-sulfate reductase [Chloroflexota bacterium]
MITTDRVTLDEYEAGELAVQYDDQEPAEVIRWAIETFGARAAICTSFQMDGMAILDMAWRIDPNVRVFTIDTGRLPTETYELIDRVREHYGIQIEVYTPSPALIEPLVRERGVNLFYKSVKNRLTCCEVRKIEPLLRVLDSLDAWITGLRRDQWATRSNIRKIELDHDHGGIVKVNPLADWMEDEVLAYLQERDVPQHPLYSQGYRSIGCAPCTRAVKPGEDPRAGRWWWEKNAPKECGMHCAIETGGFEHEAEAILAENEGAGSR